LNIKTIIICTKSQCTIEETGAKSNGYPEYYMSGVNNVDMINCNERSCTSLKGK